MGYGGRQAGRGGPAPGPASMPRHVPGRCRRILVEATPGGRSWRWGPDSTGGRQLQ
ncbi:hypothetical protein ACFQZ4_36940 [Catellatospora coxensis]